MNVPKSIFRQYDVRGLVDRELTPEFARALGRAFAQRGRTSGWAGRRSSPWDGTTAPRATRCPGACGRASPRRVARRSTSGLLPTPALYFAVSALRTDGGVQVTGSHNPPEFNGFKMVLAGEAFHGDDILGLWEIIMAERWRRARARRRPTDRCSSATATASSAGTSSSAR